MVSTAAMERKALGRYGIIGSLYDIRTDQLEGGNLFNSELPESFIRIQDSANVSYHTDFNNSQRETFNNMNIEASLKLSLMGGLLDVAGSAKYLKQTKTNSHTVRVTFMYKAKTKQEHLLINTADLYKYFSLDALENPNATHVVIGILWGANVAATFERVVESREAAEKLEGQLSVSLKIVAASIKGDAKINTADINNEAFESLTVSFSGDVLIKDCPQTIDGVMKTYENIPALLAPLNGGKGRQLEFVLYPLKRIAEMFKLELKVERLIKEVSEHMVIRIENIFEQISMATRKFNDFLDEIKPWEEFLPRDWLKIVKDKKAQHAGDELKTRRQLASLLEKIRSGKSEEFEMEKIVDKFDLENPCSELSIERFLKENHHVKTKIGTLKKISLDRSLLLTQVESVEDIILDFYDNDVYLLHICEQWSKKNKRNMLKQIKFFAQLKTQEANNTNAIFRVIDHDLHLNLNEKPDDCVIYYATQGSIVSHNFWKDSLTKLSRAQISFILKQNPSLTERHLLQRHADFMKEHPGGELSKNDFISEFEKLFPRGKSANYCNHVFSTIDSDKSGTMTFVEYMSANAPMQPANLKTRLSLIFAQCDHDGSQTIDATKMVKFLEAIAELQHGEKAVDTASARSVAKGMLEFFGKSQDETLTKEEFIHCCEQNYKLLEPFLFVTRSTSMTPMRGTDVALSTRARWSSSGITVAGGHGEGGNLNQLNSPTGLFVDEDQTLYVADYVNNRIIAWPLGATSGQVVAGGNGAGGRLDQLYFPTDIVVDRSTDSLLMCDRINRRVVRWPRSNGTHGEIVLSNIDCWGLTIDDRGFLYVSDFRKEEIRRFKVGDLEATVVAGGNGQGDRLDQFFWPTFLFVDRDHSVYVSDSGNNRVVKWAEGAKIGELVAGGHGKGSDMNQVFNPGGVLVDGMGTVYVTEWENPRVMRWPREASSGDVVAGGNGKGCGANQLSFSYGLSFDRHGNLYVADHTNYRVQKFELISS